MNKKTIPHSGRGVTAVLGPTNTGKTHLAIERMLAHKSGVIGLPLRLLAREVYQRIVDRLGKDVVSLITGEERIIPPDARFQICTVEAMPEHTDADFVAIDEVQLAADLERGHVFTDRLMNLRGRHETMLLGAETILPALVDLLPGINVVTRPRMSVLQYIGSKKITRMPARSAIVAFSADEVYAIAELVRRERGGAAVVMGSLSPRTRNAQVALYQSGEVDIIVATDAIGMGLNLDIKHVAFAQDEKFDGFQHRKLTAAELAQIAGRAGRHTQDGSFGVTSRVNPFPDELVHALETHIFEPAKVLTWRNRNLDFSSLDGLRSSLELPSQNPRLTKVPPLTDLKTLEQLSRDAEIADLTSNEERVSLLWEVSKIPDYRKISPHAHTEILSRIYVDLCRNGAVNEDWFSVQVSQTDQPEGAIDALSARLANVRTWTYLSHRQGWFDNASEWQEKTREVENRLSDALHEALTKRFIDRRTSVLMKRLKENTMLEAEIGDDGSLMVEGHHVGHLRGFRFESTGSGNGKDAKAANAAAAKVLAGEIESRAEKLNAAPNSDIALSNDGLIRWQGVAVAKLTPGVSAIKPGLFILADEHLTGQPLEKVQKRLERWIANHINTALKPLADLDAAENLQPVAKGVGYRLVENLGTLPRSDVANELKEIDQETRGIMRRCGVRFGAYHVFMPLLLKPAPTQLLCLLWAIHNNKLESAGLTGVPEISAAGRTSAAVDSEFEAEFYRIAGFKILGEKAVRIDILERLADLIRPTTSWKPDSGTEKPEGAVDGRRFYVTPAMMSILGATHENMAIILKMLGYRDEKRLEYEVKPAVDTLSANVEAGRGEKTELPNISKQPDEISVEASDTSSDERAPTQMTSPESNSEDETKTAGAADEPEGPKMISVWRYGGNSGNSKRGQKGQKTHQKPKHDKGGKPHRAKGIQSATKKPEKKPDPDSPFAKLAALKAELSDKNG